jgi:endonuclease YncB( thermonuclease family)
MRAFMSGLLLLVPGSAWAAEAIILDGDTLRLGGTSYKLDGIDAPEPIKSAFRGMELSEWSASLGNPLSFFMAGGQAHAGRPTRSCRP